MSLVEDNDAERLLRQFTALAFIMVTVLLDVLALGILAVETFVEACPEEVRREHEAAIKAKESIFDRDVRDTVGAARYSAGRMVNRVRSRIQRKDEYPSVSEGLGN